MSLGAEKWESATAFRRMAAEKWETDNSGGKKEWSRSIPLRPRDNQPKESAAPTRRKVLAHKNNARPLGRAFQKLKAER